MVDEIGSLPQSAACLKLSGGTPLRLFRIAVALTACLSCGQPAVARIWHERSVVEIAVDAEVIVVARPMYDWKPESEPEATYSSKTWKKPSRPFPFIVSRVLIGKGVQPGQLILIENYGSNHLINIFREDRFQTKSQSRDESKSEKPRVKETLLFLHSELAYGRSHADYRLVYDGIRILTLEGRTLVPKHWGTFADQSKISSEYWKDGNFDEMIQLVSASNATIRLLRRFRHILSPKFPFVQHDVSEFDAPGATLFGYPILSQSVFAASNPQKNLPPVHPQTNQP